MNKGRGYLKVLSIGGVPVLVHWSIPAGGIVVSLFGHVDPKEWVYYCVAFTLLVIVHESGHVLATVALRLRVLSVEISGVGGLCHVERPTRVSQSVVIYSAGLLAQAFAGLLAIGYVQLFGFPDRPFARASVVTFTVVNLFLWVINLIPRRNSRSGLATDGWVLWKLLLHVARGHPHPHPPITVTPPEQAPVFPAETRLLDKPGFCPPGFVHGIEILNDRMTPMEFVVAVLTNHLELSREEAIITMLEIHNNGGILIALPSEQHARAVAEAVSQQARSSGHDLTCRYAGALVPSI